MTTSQTGAPPHPHTKVLRDIYRDLPSLADYAAVDIVLHRADRIATDPSVCSGIRAALAHERALLRLTQDTLIMDVQHITANDHFGAVLGVLRASHPRSIAMPFCGLWRFVDGRIVEHWENAYDPTALRNLLAPPQPAAN